ncbi:type II toxin-antitoxin system VapC family toxin [Candidatus Gottesmanbacteria bacterium]|nr:type II toxin-antitoxin system VapC family toxin [Candidatus Gottesmanbacteria bacterium]
MKKLVVDSSVMLKWVNQDNELYVENANQILSDVKDGKVILLAPELAKYELGNAILKKGIDVNQAYQNLETISSLPVEFITETINLAYLTYQMAYEVRLTGDKKFTYYDASFVALAKQEEAVLVTDNPKHQSKINGVKVVPLEEYK